MAFYKGVWMRVNEKAVEVVRGHEFRTDSCGDPSNATCRACGENLVFRTTLLVRELEGDTYEIHIGCLRSD
jgi:hypothetical protein